MQSSCHRLQRPAVPSSANLPAPFAPMHAPSRREGHTLRNGRPSLGTQSASVQPRWLHGGLLRDRRGTVSVAPGAPPPPMLPSCSSARNNSLTNQTRRQTFLCSGWKDGKQTSCARNQFRFQGQLAPGLGLAQRKLLGRQARSRNGMPSARPNATATDSTLHHRRAHAPVARPGTPAEARTMADCVFAAEHT